MTHILYICPSTGVGGAETFLKQSFIHSDKENYKVHYLLFKQGALYDFLTKNKASVYLMGHRPRISKWGDHQLVRQKIRDIVNEQNIDIIHSTMAYGAIFAAWPAKQMGIKHVWFQHCVATGWMDRAASLLPHNGLMVNSHYTSQRQRELENSFRFLIPRTLPIEKILLGTDIQKPEVTRSQSFRSELNNKYNIDSSKIIISMLCRVQSPKGVHLLLEALELLKDFHPKIHCLIWGDAFGGDEYFNQMNKTIKQNQLPASLAGHCENVDLALSNSKILVNSSTQPESFGLSIIEAMMVGCVPIAPKEGGPLEIISHGKDGMLFKPRQAEDLAQNIKTLLSDSELLDRLSQETQKTAENKFQAQRTIQHLEQFYSKVMQS
jgi:glycosyltransferase involved in cell wall biosynthesis